MELMCRCLETCAYALGMSNVRLRCAMWAHAMCQAEWSLSNPLHSLLSLSSSLTLHPVILPFLRIRSHQHTGNSLEPKNRARKDRKTENSEERVSFSICYCAIQIRSSRKRSSNIHLSFLSAQRVTRGQCKAPIWSILHLKNTFNT